MSESQVPPANGGEAGDQAGPPPPSVNEAEQPEAAQPEGAQPGATYLPQRATNSLIGIVITLYAVGLVVIVGYALSTSAKHSFQYIGVGVLTAFAATLTGSLLGFLLGIPRAVSSGTLRQEGSAPPATGKDGVPLVATPPAQSSQAARFAQSTNLAEISDWLTKLLLGAGLVSLTKLGHPLGALIHKVATGLVSDTASTTAATSATSDTSGTAVVLAGGILIAYTILGFISAYVVTTVWYWKILDRIY